MSLISNRVALCSEVAPVQPFRAVYHSLKWKYRLLRGRTLYKGTTHGFGAMR